MRCVTPGGYSGHYKGIEEGAAYCHTRSTTCHEQDEEEGQRRAQNVGENYRRNEEIQGEPFLCFASSGRCFVWCLFFRAPVVHTRSAEQNCVCFLGLPSVHSYLNYCMDGTS